MREYLVCFVDFVVVAVVAILFSVCVYFVVVAVVAILFICLSVLLWSVDLFFFFACFELIVSLLVSVAAGCGRGPAPGCGAARGCV